MACQYFERGGFFEESICGVTKKRIPNYTANNVCDTWGSYTECEYYKRASSICFITSAACFAMGLPDDCEELTLLRSFRDKWLKAQEFGESDIAEYYDCAPKICSVINTSERAKEVYQEIYDAYILPCIAFIKKMEYLACYNLYKSMVRDLKSRYAGQQEPGK